MKLSRWERRRRAVVARVISSSSVRATRCIFMLSLCTGRKREENFQLATEPVSEAVASRATVSDSRPNGVDSESTQRLVGGCGKLGDLGTAALAISEVLAAIAACLA